MIYGALKNVGPGTGHQETFWVDGNVPYLDLCDGYIRVDIC